MVATLTRTADRHAGRATLAIVSLAQFMLVLDVSIVNVALPVVRSDLGMTTRALQWVVTSYALVFGGLLLLAGRGADLLGHRRMFMAGMVIFMVASLACGLAPDGMFLIIARAVEGLGAAIVSPATLSILMATFTGEARRRALAIWTAASISGGAVGGLLGGMLTQEATWRLIFFINVPVGLALLAAGRADLPLDAVATRRHRPDVVGALLVTGGVAAIVFACTAAGAEGLRSVTTGAAIAVAAMALVGFWAVERRSQAPVVPPTLVRSREVVIGNVLGFLSFMAVFANWYFLSLYLQGVRGYSPAAVGLAFLPLTLAVIAGSQLGFAALRAFSPRVAVGGGALVAAAGLFWIGARLTPQQTVVGILLADAWSLVGGGVIFAPITVAATAAVARSFSGVASGLLNTTRQLGGAVGLAVLSTIATAYSSHAGSPSSAAGRTSGYAVAFTVGAAVFVITAAVGAFLGGAKDDGDPPLA
jgi:EmrB/QacA subfamily drug resistance transporter